MGHGCHDCGSPNSCHCPGSHGDWYNQFTSGKTKLDYELWKKEYKMGHYDCRKCEQLHCVCVKSKDQPEPYAYQAKSKILDKNVKALSEVELIGVLITNLPHLEADSAQRVLDYAQRLFDDKHGKKKVCRDR